jgi:NodT family efflux transporter outer membrane factor (OMF) lipoprotein
MALLLGACSVGPNYQRPAVATPASYKKSGIWKPANPSDDLSRGKWWEIYHDPQLNALEAQVNISNQNVLMYEAQFVEAAAAVKVARAALFPTITASPSFNESKSSSAGSRGGLGIATGSGSTGTTGTGTTGTGTTGTGTTTVGGSGAVVSSTSPTSFYELPASASYVVDIWGAVRRNIQANSRTAQATFGDLENARLSYQSTLAEDYFELLGLDAEKQLLDNTIGSYQKYLDLTKNRYNSGIASAGDVATAQAQLDAARVQEIDLGVDRVQYQDAIAVLVGRPAPEFSIRFEPLKAVPPKIPLSVPSEVLQRRPDVAAAERRVASANATIGVNVAAYYPQLTLTATTGLEAVQFSQLFSGPAFFWSLGPTLAQTIFDAGKIHGQVQEARASYNAAVATYRQTVLTAFQQVEDNLGALRVLQAETTAEQSAVESAKKSLDIATNQYKAGTEDYLFVITAQGVYLNDEVNAVMLQTREMAASVLLVQALGGGWDVSKLATGHDVSDVPQSQAKINKAKSKN